VALELLAELSFGETSEIYRQLVLEEQTVESIGADLNRTRDPGLLDITARVKKAEDVAAVRAAIDRTLSACRTRPPDPGRLADLKSRLKYGFLMSLDTPDAVASRLARIVALTGGIEAVDRLYATYDTITPEDVQAAARRYLVDARRTVGTLEGAR
jgi:zinc protease